MGAASLPGRWRQNRPNTQEVPYHGDMTLPDPPDTAPPPVPSAMDQGFSVVVPSVTESATPLGVPSVTPIEKFIPATIDDQVVPVDAVAAAYTADPTPVDVLIEETLMLGTETSKENTCVGEAKEQAADGGDAAKKKKAKKKKKKGDEHAKADEG